jgi:superfamily I DNA/RNA helicase
MSRIGSTAPSPKSSFDESYAFREHRARWLYTGITRAAKRLTVVV